MQVYFSHSYRDVAINSSFLELFLDEELPLIADQKTEIWCVAKLERYMAEMTGFVSIIPWRPTDADPNGYSPYIGHELTLARRARVPRLLFVDAQVLRGHRPDFPEDAVPFRPDALDADRDQRGGAIREFRKLIETAHRPARPSRSGEAVLVVGTGSALRGVAREAAEVIRREGYVVTVLAEAGLARGLEGVDLLETLWRAELCVFLLGDRLSNSHLALAMAHAHTIPSVRLRYDPRVPECGPSVTGVVRWRTTDEMLAELGRQLAGYKQGMVRPVDLAQSSNPADAARAVGTMQWQRREENRWDLRDGPALVRHVHPEFTFVRDEVNRAGHQAEKALGLLGGREGGIEVCTLLYDGIKRHRFAYATEQEAGQVGVQSIRTPRQIVAHGTATCIDAACLFGSLLEAAGQNPVVAVLEGRGSAHALAGYRVRGEPPCDVRGLGDLLGAVARRDVVLFEATGAVESDRPVGAETAGERPDKVLAFMDSVAAAERFVKREEVRLAHYVDVRVTRGHDARPGP